MSYQIVHRNEDNSVIGVRCTGNPPDNLVVDKKDYTLNAVIPNRFGYFECFYILGLTPS